MAGPLSVFLFGDQDSQCRDHLGELMLTGSNPILNTFFDQAALSLRQEIQRLPWSQRDSFPSFSNFLDLLAIEASKPLHPGLQLALSTVHHCAVFICRKSWETKNSVSSTSSYTFGLGTGLLAAAATSCYTNLEQFIPIALDTVLISFRIGLLAANTRDQIVDRADVGSWRIRVETDKPASVLSQVEDFCAQKHLQPWSKPYACDTSETSVLLGGPPATLEALTQAYSLKASPSAVYAPFHASTIYSENDVEAISQSFSPALTHVVSKLTLLSHHNGTALPPQTLPSLLRMAVRAILSESLASDAALHSIKGMTQSQASQPCTVISIGAPYGSRLESVLETTESSLERMTYVNDETIVSHATKAQYARQSKIAITGFSGRFPQAKNNEAFWDVIHNGVDTHAVTPKSRWDVKTHVDPTLKGKNTSAAAYGCWLDTPGAFDRSFFSISPREAPQMDPAQRLAMMCAYEAVEMSGIVTDSTPSTMKSRVGVFIGTTSSDWCETNSAQDVDNYFIPGGNRAFIPGRVNYYFKFSGPSFSVDTACSSSLAATHLACNALWRGDIDCAIIGGTNVLTNPDVTAGLDRGHFLSRTGNCKTFDDEADGYCRGEGTGIIVLKRLEDAQADNDPIHGCILAAATNHSAEAESITRPHVGAQRTLFSDVLAKGGVHPNDISYVEMHGTGTQAGDGREMASVSQTFAPWPQGDPRCRTNDLHVGSVKANVGHGEAAAGVTALIKVLLMMQKDEIPPHCGIKTKINQTFPPDLKERRVLIADRPKPWVRSNKPRRVLLNNFSAAGGNSCVLLEDGPGAGAEDLHTRPDTRPAHVVTLTAKSKTALEANTKSLASLLKSSNSISLSDLAYTSTARRLHYNFRASYPAQTIQELAASLERDTADPPQQARGAPKILFAFSGQGSTHAGMGRYLYETNSSFRTALDRFDTITQSQGFGSILPYIRGTGDANDESAASITQLSQVALQMALARLWDSWGISPAGVLGHSLGEYAALNFAGVLSDFDTLWVCGQRAKLLESHCKAGTHAMLAIRSSQADVDACLSGVATEIACMNGAQQTVISGSNADIDQASARLTSKGINFSRMKVPYAFHSSQLQPILGDFSKILNGITLRSPKVPIFSPLTSKVIKPGDEVDRDYLLRQCREAVNLVGAVQAGEDASLLNDRTHIIEIGPSNVLARLTQRATQHSPTIMPSLETNQDSWLVLSKSVAAAYRVGCNINWAQYHRDYDHAVIQLPSYNWDLKDYWIQYVNDWSLRKGDPLPIAAAASELQLTTTSCQKVISAKSEGDVFHAVVESNLQSPDLKPIVAGHQVNGISVCIGAVYADMASACAESIYKHFQTDLTDTTILVKAMDMQESLIITDGPAPQIMRIDAKYSQKSKNIEIQITSGGKDGQPTKMHAKTTVVLNDVQKEKKDLQSKLGPVMPKIQQVKDDVSEGLADRFTTSMAYRMVASLAHYDDSHKGVKESCLNSSTMEGHSIIATPERHRLQGDFSVHPCVFDSILQLATFVTNAHENSKFEQEVYVVKGWDNMFIDQRLSLKEQYETYVKMNTSNKEVGVGDILITKGGNLIGCIEGVRVTRVPRRLMDVMFKPKTEAPSARQPAKQNAELQAIATEMRKKPAGPSKLDRALAIISEESGILIPEMKDGDFFADLGIDSLLILVIASRFREELTLDLSASFFVDVDSIGAIRKYFNDLESPEEIVEVPVTATATEVPTTDGPLKLDTALSIIAEESGISIPEMKDEDYLSDLGIDSLLLLVIASRFREELSLDLSASFFADVDSIGAIKNYFKSLDAPSTGAITPESQDDSDSASSQSGRSTPSEATTASEAPEPTPAPKNPNAKPPRSTSILLQGTITPTTKTMFLFPDGSGSATSYMHLPRVDSSVAVVAMNCPYMTTPTQMTGTFEDITALLLAEVRRRQPHGPYYIGGWSAGGAFAHYAARMLIDAGEEVKALLLIDAPAPIGLGKLPESFFKYWREIHQPGGIAQDRPLPPWIMDHFKAVNENLRWYTARPLPKGKSPETYLVWAAKGTDNLAGFPFRHTLTEQEDRDLGFLMDDKTDFSTKGWEGLVEGQIQIEKAMGSNHFTITRGEGAKMVSQLIRRSCKVV